MGSIQDRGPLLTVVLTSYNYARFLPQAIEAILGQSLQADQFLIIDDASTDDSVRILREYALKNPDIRLIVNDRNEGVIACLNRGLELATGRYLVYATADDLVLPGLFEKSLSLMKAYPPAAFCSSLATVMNEEGREQGIWPSPVVGPKGYIDPLRAIHLMRRHGFWLMGNTAVFRKQVLVDEGGFASELGPYSDSFVCMVMALRYGACFIPEPLACWRRVRSAYSTQALADPEQSLEFLDCAERLMKTTHKGMFPSDYIKQWRRERLYDMAVITAEKGADDKQDYLDSFRRVLSPLSGLDRFFLSLLKDVSPGRLLALKLYLLIRFRLLTWNQVKRRVLFRARRFMCRS